MNPIEINRIEQKHGRYFFHMEYIDDELGLIHYAKWMNSEEENEYKTKKKTIKEIAEKYRHTAKLLKIKENETPNVPPEEPE